MVAMIITITVAGTIALQYLPHLMICPDFAAVATPTTFAEAPIGVALPPISVPIARDHARMERSTPCVAARLLITGIIVAANGILSINALATADTQIIMAIITFRLPPLTLPINPARMVRISPMCGAPEVTRKHWNRVWSMQAGENKSRVFR